MRSRRTEFCADSLDLGAGAVINITAGTCKCVAGWLKRVGTRSWLGTHLHLRYSGKPSKQLLWLFLARDMRRSRGFGVGIDVGCGPMRNRPYFATEDYIGVDLSPDRLAAGRKRYPGSLAVAGRAEQNCGLAGDVVLCVQMFVNKHFAVEDTLAAAANLAAMTRQGGMLVFNISKRNFAYEAEIDALLNEKFAIVDKVKYGALSAPDLGLLSPIVAFAMLLLPPLRRGRGYQKIYYRCQNRR